MNDAGVPDARTDAAVDVTDAQPQPEIVSVPLTPTWGRGFDMDLVTRLHDGRAAIIAGNPNTRTEAIFRLNPDGSFQNMISIDLEGCGGSPPQSLMEQSDGGFLLTCTYGGAQRVDSNGRIMWSFPESGMAPRWTIHATHQDNQVIRVVSSNVMERGEIRLDGSGQAQFIRTWSTTLAPFGTNETVSIAEDGRVHALGLNIGDATTYIETLLTLNPSGQIDSRRMNTVPATRSYTSWFEPLSDGGVLQFNFNSPTVTNLNRQGVPRWSWASGRTDIQVRGCAEIGGRVFVSGVTTRVHAYPDAFWLAQLNASGTLRWERVYRDTGRNVTYYDERSYLIPVTNGFLAAMPISPPGYGSVSVVILPFDQEGRMR